MHRPFAADWRALPGVVRHTFTHIHLQLSVMATTVNRGTGSDGVWVAPDDFGDLALPSLMRKVARHAMTYGSDAGQGIDA